MYNHGIGEKNGMNIFDELRIEYGSLKKFAELVGVTTTTVYRWQTAGKIPMGRLNSIEIATQNKFTKKSLRPDLF